MLIVFVLKGEYIGASIMLLATIGLAAINEPIDNYLANANVARSMNKLLGGKILSNPYNIKDKELTNSVLE
jgi:hypothetical protein